MSLQKYLGDVMFNRDKDHYHGLLAYIASFRCTRHGEKLQGACLVNGRSGIMGISYAGYPQRTKDSQPQPSTITSMYSKVNMTATKQWLLYFSFCNTQFNGFQIRKH